MWWLFSYFMFAWPLAYKENIIHFFNSKLVGWKNKKEKKKKGLKKVDSLNLLWRLEQGIWIREKKLFSFSWGLYTFILIYLIFHKVMNAILLFQIYGKITLNIAICLCLCISEISPFSFFFVFFFLSMPLFLSFTLLWWNEKKKTLYLRVSQRQCFTFALRTKWNLLVFYNKGIDMSPTII